MRNAPKFCERYTHPSLSVSDCKTVVTGNGGYRSAIATSPKYIFPLYFEAQIESDTGYARIGVATLECEINGPVGMDEYGYSYGSKNGYGFHKARRIRMGERYKKRDIVSVYLYKDKKSKVFSLEFFLNGNKAGGPFNLNSNHEYWPALSLFGGCSVSINMGPYFAYDSKIKSAVEMQKQALVSPGKKKRLHA
ncbi:Set1/Ash2 histone methyltransferase complex subunit ASH2 [Pancytospora epiphaga]|nr:Set1/Ash2 histone methyltransferase complex subunit ASH2 [Pancytospora epiphaga]